MQCTRHILNDFMKGKLNAHVFVIVVSAVCFAFQCQGKILTLVFFLIAARSDMVISER